MNNSQQLISQTRRFFDELFNKENLSICDELIDPNVKLEDPAQPEQTKGIKAFKDCENNYKQAFPNKKINITDIFATDDKVVIRWACQGIHKGNFKGIPATNKPFKITGISIYRFANGKITEIWQSWDQLGLLEQIGQVHLAHAHH